MDNKNSIINTIKLFNEIGGGTIDDYKRVLNLAIDLIDRLNAVVESDAQRFDRISQIVESCENIHSQTDGTNPVVSTFRTMNNSKPTETEQAGQSETAPTGNDHSSVG